MSNKKALMKTITFALNNAASKSKSEDLSAFCNNMMIANKVIDQLGEEYDDEKNTKSITQRYFNFSKKNKEIPLNRFNNIILFCRDPKNKQGFFGKIFKEATIVKISKLVEKVSKNFDSLMKEIGGKTMWNRIIKYNHTAKSPISYKVAATIYSEDISDIHNHDLFTYTYLPNICTFFGYEDEGSEYKNIFDNVSNCCKES